MAQGDGADRSRMILYVVLGLAALCGCGSLGLVALIVAIVTIGPTLGQTFDDVSDDIEAEAVEQADEPDEADEAPTQAEPAPEEDGGPVDEYEGDEG